MKAEEKRVRSPLPRVLVVDDQASMAETLADGLGDLGYAAVAISSGEAAAKLLGAEPFDALVTDLRMPGTDGLALLAVARKVTPDLPVIVMTAFSAVDTAIESIRQGRVPLPHEAVQGRRARAVPGQGPRRHPRPEGGLDAPPRAPAAVRTRQSDRPEPGDAGSR